MDSEHKRDIGSESTDFRVSSIYVIVEARDVGDISQGELQKKMAKDWPKKEIVGKALRRSRQNS